MADDPLLTDRSGGAKAQTAAVILDSYLRIPLQSRVIQTAEQDVLVLCSTSEEPAKQALEAKGFGCNRSRRRRTDDPTLRRW